MSSYLYNYQTVVTFSMPVRQHAVMLRCQPAENGVQTVVQEHVTMPDNYQFCPGHDAFSNRILYGGIMRPHSAFVYVSTGIVRRDLDTYDSDCGFLPVYSLPSQLTGINSEMKDFALSAKTAGGNTAEILCEKVFNMMRYAPETTTVITKAEDVFSLRCGVCQDYAHLMTALCRAAGISARYVNGFVEGTGQTHAWVEVFDGRRWLGYDPTHNRTAQKGYVKIAHGRDANDCPVNRGIFYGNAVQITQISVTLQEL